MKNWLIFGGVLAGLIFIARRKAAANQNDYANLPGALSTEAGREQYTNLLEKVYGGTFTLDSAGTLTQVPGVQKVDMREPLTASDAQSTAYAFGVFPVGSRPPELLSKGMEFYNVYYGKTVADPVFQRNLDIIFSSLAQENLASDR